MTENDIQNRIPSTAGSQQPAYAQAQNFQPANNSINGTHSQAAFNVSTPDNSTNIRQIALRDIATLESLVKAGIINPTQGQHLTNYILNKAQEVLVNQPSKAAFQPQSGAMSGIDEFVKEKPDFFKTDARAQVLDYLKNSNAGYDKDGIMQISQLIEALEQGAINGYLQQQAHEKTLNDENSAAKLRLTANAQNQNSTDNNTRIFTREQIGKMSGAEFAQNEKAIMEQLKKGLIR